MPLRTRLVLILVLLLAVALAAIETITYGTIQTSLTSTVDSQMKSSVGAWEEYFQTCEGGHCNPGLQAFDGVQPDTYGKAYSLNGKTATFPTFSGGRSSAGNLDPKLAALRRNRNAASPRHRARLARDA